MSYKFKVGDTGKTKGGKDYEVIAVEVPGLVKGRSVVAVVDGYAYCLTAEGREYSDHSVPCTHSYDLLPPEQYVYLNVYNYKQGRIQVNDHPTALEAELQASNNVRINGDDVTYHHIALPVLLKQGNG